MVKRSLEALRSRGEALRTVLGNRPLALVQTSWLGFNVAEYAIVVGISVYAFAAGGAIGVGVVAAVRTIPGLIVGPLGSVLADRQRRERVMQFSLIARMAAIAALTIVVAADGHPYVVYALAALDASASTLYWPAKTALGPELGRSAKELAAANALASALENAGTLIGPVLAAVALAYLSFEAVFVAALVVLGLAVLAILPVRSDRVVHHRGSRDGGVFDGVRFIAREREPRSVVALWTVESLLVGMAEVFAAVVALEVLGMGDPGVGILNALTGLGGLVGAVGLSATRRGHPYGKTMWMAVLVFGGAFVLTGAGSIVAVAVVGFLLMGVAGGRTDIAAQTLLQRLVADHHLGRVLGAFEGLYWGSLGLGALGASFLIVAVGARGALAIAGAIGVVAAVASRSRLATIDDEVAEPPAARDLLREVDLFGFLPVATVDYLARHAEEVVVGEGADIVVEGDSGETVYVVADGGVVVIAGGMEVARLGPSDHFGEIAPLEGSTRTATVRAVEPTTLLAIDGPLFVASVTGHAHSRDAAEHVVVARLAEAGKARHR